MVKLILSSLIVFALVILSEKLLNFVQKYDIIYWKVYFFINNRR